MTELENPNSPAWDDVKEILADALEVPAEDLGAFLDRACRGDPALRAEVESLLPTKHGAQAKFDRFLAESATNVFESPSPEPGSTIGGYQVRKLIGEGGMGRVYEATQERPHRTVALKILRPGFLAPDAERRFHWEVEALGRLSHTSIAAVHDAGVEDMGEGHKMSWFAMEKVDGDPLLKAADRLELDRSARLQLFLRITEGIVHAHQRGVLHRDLKPDNILVDDQAKPHILDFGIARVADPLASSITTAGEIVGTLAYMSPEQLLGDPERVDARSDVYALGGILYRLLTGEPPHRLDGMGLPQVARYLAETDPRLAGELDRSLRGDLETVLDTALARDVDRRYPTVDALAQDVRRVLAGEPIQARPPTAWYQLQKFAQRNRALVAGATATFAALVLAVIGTSVGFLRAADQRDHAEEARKTAEEERDHAQEINDFVTEMLASADPEVAGADVRVVDLLESAGEKLTHATDMPPRSRAGLHETLGMTYRSLAMPEPALLHAGKAEELFEDLDGPESTTALGPLGIRIMALADLGELDEAEALLGSFRTRVRAHPDASDTLAMWPLAMEEIIADYRGDIVRSLELSAEIYEEWLERVPVDSLLALGARNNYAVGLMGNWEFGAARELLVEGIELAQENAESAENLAAMQSNLAQVLEELGEYDESLRIYDELVDRATSLWGDRHSKTATLWNNRASLYLTLGDRDRALSEFLRVLELRREINGDRHVSTIALLGNVSSAYQQLGRNEESLKYIDEALRAMEGNEQVDVLFRLRTEGNRSTSLASLGRDAEAAEVTERVLRGFEEALGEEHMQSIIARNNLAMQLMALGEGGQAVEHAEENLRIAEQAQPDSPMNTFPLRMNLGRALASAGQHERAEKELLAVNGALAASYSALPHQRARIREILHGFYLDWDKPERAAAFSAE